MEREILVHELKAWPEFFKDLASQAKTFEVCRDDRDFQVGDILWLREWDPRSEAYSGREVRRRITYRTEKGSFLARDGFVVLGICDASDPARKFVSPSAKPRYQLTDLDWQGLLDAAKLPSHIGCRVCNDCEKAFAREINTTIFLAEEGLRKALAADLRSLGAAHPELAPWAETLACRYARGEEAA
jgi:Domain of unknown function (DUF3850)